MVNVTQPYFRFQDPQIRPRGMGYHILRRTFVLFRPFRWKLLAGGFFIGITGFCMSLMPMFSRQVIKYAIPHRDFKSAVLIMLCFLGAMAVRMAAWYAGQCFVLPIREKIIFALRTRVFSRLQELCMRFHQRYSAGYLFDRTLGGASTAIGTFLTMFFNTLVVNFFVLVFSITICMRLNPGLTFWVLCMSILYVITSRFFYGRIHMMTREFNKKNNEFAGQVTDLLRGIKTIKAFAMEQRVITEFDEQLWPLQLRSLELNKENMRLSFVVEGLNYFVNAAVVVGGAYLVMHSRHFDLGTLVAFIGYQAMLTSIISGLSTIAPTYGAATAGLEQLYEILDERSTVVDKKNAVMPKKVTGELTLENVQFGYNETTVINGVSLIVPPGQSVALVGPSGGGKSTLINLLLRFYDPDKGMIRLDGQDIRQLPLAAYRSLFGVVLQDPFLFNDTIYNNLIAVKPEATDAELRDALERAQAWEFVDKLEGGWHFNVGEGGGQLSGGQRQRIALARCFLTNPRIMVLDEATSALDNQSELLVQQALQEIMQQRNVFVIAHRLSTVRNVDRILVIEDGQIVQDGSYQTLCQEPGLFRDLHMASLQALPDAILFEEDASSV